MPKVEPKVKAATGGASAAALVCWALTHFVFHGALPVPVEALVDVGVPGGVALVGGYLTPHRTPPVNSTVLHFPASADPKVQAAEGTDYMRKYYRWLSTPATQPAQNDDSHWYATGGPITPGVAIASDPVRPAEAAQPATPNPEGNTMSVLDQFRTLVEQLRGEIVGKVGAEVVDDVHAAVDLFKGQAQQLLIAAGHDAETDATQVASEVAQVATDTAGAVAPAPVAPAPAEAAPVDPAAPAA